MRKLFFLIFLFLICSTPTWGDSVLPDSLLAKLEGKTGKDRLDVWRKWHYGAKIENYDIPTYLASLDYYCQDLEQVYAPDSALYWCYKRKMRFARHSDSNIESQLPYYKDILLETKMLADSIAAVFGSPHMEQMYWHGVYARFWEANGNKEKSIEQLELALGYNETFQDEESFFYLWRNLSYYYFEVYKRGTAGYDKGVEYMKKAEKLMTTADIHIRQKLLFSHEIGLFYRVQEKYKEAEPYFKAVVDSIHRIAEKNRVFYQVEYLSVLSELGQAKDVIDDFEVLYNDPKVKANPFMWRKLLLNYCIALSYIGEYDKFLDVNKELNQLDWKEEREGMAESVVGLRTSLELIEKETQLKSLEQKRISDQARFRTTLLIAVICGLLVLMGLFFFFQVNKSKKERLTLKQEEDSQIAENRNRLFSSITHDIRTPLALMMGPVERAKQKAKSPNTINDLNLVTRNGQKLMDLFTQILDWNKVESDALYLNPQVGALEITLPLIIKRLQQEAIEKGISFKSNIEVSAGQFKLDFDKLEKILVNISKNAFKFCPAGSAFFIDIKNQNNFLELNLRDNGPGILKTDLPFVFDRYFQGVNGTGKGGTGIGLAIVKEVVDLMDGTITLDSTVQKGTQFFIRLPVEYIAESEESFSATEHSESAEKPQILVVEDEPELLAFIESSLQNRFNVTTADSSTIGWSLVQSQLPDIIISDWNLPDETGGWLCNKVKTNILTGHIPVLILTANDSDLNRKEAFSAGAVAWMGKPFRLENLKKQLQSILSQQAKTQKLWSRIIEREEKENTDEKQEELDPFMKSVLDLMKANYSDEKFSVDQMAENLNIHRVQLSRKIKNLSGKRPSVLIKEYRLNKAKVLLNTTAKSISEIAYAIGFSNANYFATAYKKQFNISPTQERRS